VIALDQKDLVYISEIRDDGLMVARYGKDSKRSDHLCCPRCTNETQIFPVNRSPLKREACHSPGGGVTLGPLTEAPRSSHVARA
jgi:hypothetical protein